MSGLVVVFVLGMVTEFLLMRALMRWFFRKDPERRANVLREVEAIRVSNRQGS